MTIDRQWLAEAAGYTDPKTMCIDLYKKHKSVRICSKYLGISTTTFRGWLDDYHIQKQPLGGANHVGEHEGTARQLIKSLKGKVDDMCCAEICNRYNINPGGFRKVAREFNVKWKKYARL